jgi:hypothetical protein
MLEPEELQRARELLARAEADYRSADGLSQLEAALALLDEVMSDAAEKHRTVARNLASTYATRMIGRIRQQVGSDRGLPEPEMEHLFKVIIAFDEIDIELPSEARAVKLDLARRLIDRYYEGHSAAAKARAVDELTKLAGDAPGRSRPRER